MVFKLFKKTNEFFCLFKQGFVEKSEVPLFKRFIFYLFYRTSIDEMRADVMYHLYNGNLRKAQSAISKLDYFSSGLTFYEKQFALDVAIFKNNLDVVIFLLEINVDVNYPSLRNRMHELPISFAMRMQHYRIVDALIDAGSFPELPPSQKEKFTALHYACMDGNLIYMEKMLRLGADPNRQTDLGHTALFYAVTNHHRILTYRLIEEGAQVLPLKSKQKSLRDKNGPYFSLIIDCFNLYHSIITENELCIKCLQTISKTSQQFIFKFSLIKKDSSSHHQHSQCTISCCKIRSHLENLSSQFSEAVKAELMVEMNMIDQGMSLDFQKAFQVDIDALDEDGVPVVVRLVRGNNTLKLQAALHFMPRLNNFSDVKNSPLLCALHNRNGRRMSFIIAAAAGNQFSSHSKASNASVSTNLNKSNFVNISINITKFKIKNCSNKLNKEKDNQSSLNKELQRKVLARLSILHNEQLSLLLYLAGFPCIQVPIPIHNSYGHQSSNHKLLQYNEHRVGEWVTMDGCKIGRHEWQKADRVMSLKNRCRVVIRRAVSEHLNGAVLSPNVLSQLPLPSLLSHFLLFQDLPPDIYMLINDRTLITPSPRLTISDLF